MMYKCQKCGDTNYLSKTVVISAYKSRSRDDFHLCEKCYAQMIKGINVKEA